MAAKATSLAEKIHDCADEAITYERLCNPPAQILNLMLLRKERIPSTLKALLPTQGVFVVSLQPIYLRAVLYY